MTRRPIAILGAVVLLLATPALAANKTLSAQRIFRYYDKYLSLPAAERSHFTVGYYLHQGDQGLAAPVWLVQGGRRTPIPLRADGKILRLPTAAELADGQVEIGVDEATKLGLALGPEPVMAPSTDLDAHELALAIDQAAAGMKKMAGVMSLALPKLQTVTFPGAPSGEVVFADGRRAPLPLVKGVPTYNPTIQPNAKRIHLAKPPVKLDID